MAQKLLAQWKVSVVFIAAAIIAFGLWKTQPISNSNNALAASNPVTMYTSPTCSCCTEWAKYMQRNGFKVQTKLRANDALRDIKEHAGITPNLASCHTAEVGGFTVEGHVPADVILTLLEEWPDVQGITVPGMPLGSPGMKSPTPQPYNVLTFNKTGATSNHTER